MKKTNEERFEEAAPSFRKLGQSILFTLKELFRSMLGLKPDPALPKRKRPRVGKDPTPRQMKRTRIRR